MKHLKFFALVFCLAVVGVLMSCDFSANCAGVVDDVSQISDSIAAGDSVYGHIECGDGVPTAP